MLIAEHDAGTRRALRRVIDEASDFSVLADVADAAAAVRAAIEATPDVCLISASIPGDSAAAGWEITSRLPRTQLAILVGADGADDLVSAIRSGVRCFVRRDAPPAELIASLRGLVAGDVVLDAELTAQLLEQLRDRTPKRRTLVGPAAAHLTSREWEVWQLLCDGATTREIADRLNLVPATVRSHVAAVMRKLGAPDRASVISVLRADPPPLPR